jgi:hypothetical protein
MPVEAPRRYGQVKSETVYTIGTQPAIPSCAE